MAEQSTDDEWKKLPTEEQCRHKTWSARVNGYKDCEIKFRQLEAKSPEFLKFLGLIKGFVTDGHATAQEKGLDAALAFVENAAAAPKTAGEVCNGIIQKCLGAMKAKIREKGQEIILMYIELEKQDIVIEELIQGTTNKNPKVVAGSVQTLKLAVRDFGVKVISPKAVTKIIPALMEDRDKNVREETKALTVELHRWLGAAMKSLLDGLKPVQLAEIDAECKENQGKAVPTRLLRSQQAKPAADASATAQASGSVDAAEGAGSIALAVDGGDAIDPWDLLDPVDVLGKLGKEFIETLESPTSKWSERKESLESFLKLLMENPKLDPQAQYGEVVTVLKKLIAKDSNIQVVAAATKCLAHLASGLRKKFAPFAQMCLGVVVEKFKEKKQTVVVALREAVDAIFKTTTLDAIAEDMIAGLENKNPSVKAEVALFLSRCFAITHPSVLNKKLLKIYVSPLVKTLNEAADPGVRDASAEALGVAMKVVGEKAIQPFFGEIDALKKAKIQEFCDKTNLNVSIIGVRPPGAAAATKPVAPLLHKDDQEQDGEQPSANVQQPVDHFAVSAKPSKAQGSKAAAMPSGPPTKAAVSKAGVAKSMESENGEDAATENSENRGGVSARSQSATRKVEPATKQKKEEEDYTGGALIDTNQKMQRFNDEKNLKILKWNFSSPKPEYIEQLKEALLTVCKPALYAQLFHADFKQHLKALDALVHSIEFQSEATMNSLDLLLKWISLRFFDTNPAVHNRCLEYLQLVFALCERNQYKLHTIEATSFIPYLILKSGDGKDNVRLGVRQLLKQICRIYPASKLFILIIEGVKSKNARQRTECLEELGALIEGYGIDVCQPNAKTALQQIAQNIADKDNNVRNAALNAILQAYSYVGEQIYKLIGQMSDKDLSLLKERVKRHADKPRPLIKKPSPEPEDQKKVVGGGGGSAARSATPVRNNLGINTATMVRGRGVSPGSRLASRHPNSPMPCNGNGADEQQSSGDEYEPSPASNRSATEMDSGISGRMFRLDWDYIGPSPVEPGDFDPPHGSDWTEANRLIKECDATVIDFYAKQKERNARKNLKQKQQEQLLAAKGKSPGASPTVSPNVTPLDRKIAQLSHTNMAAALAALTEIDALLKDAAKSGQLSGYVDKIVSAINSQCQLAYAKLSSINVGAKPPAAEEINKDAEDLVRLYRYIVMTLMSLCMCDNLVRQLTEAPLRDLFYNLITLLLDETFIALPDGSAVVRSVNVLVVKFVEQADFTVCLLALIRLLRDCVANPDCSLKFLDLVLKCLWKATRLVPTITREINLGRVFLEAHVFFQQFPAQFWAGKKEDTPLRTLKTLLHAFVKAANDKVLDHLNLIEHPETSEVTSYLKRGVKSGVGKDATGLPITTVVPQYAASTASSGDVASLKSDQSAVRNKELYKDQLLAIFKKIGSKDITKQGLAELYDFKQEHPDVDIAPFLKKCSDFFQDYIERGLQQIKQDRTIAGVEIKPINGQEDFVQAISHFSRAHNDLRIKNNIPDLDEKELSKPLPANLWQHVLPAIELEQKLGFDTSHLERLKPTELRERSPSLTSVTSADVQLNVKNTSLNGTFTKDPDTTDQEDLQQSEQLEEEMSNLRTRLERIKQKGK